MASVVALSGFMGSGKSAVGRRLAERLQWVFVDLDDEVEQALGVPIPEYFRVEGEASFRTKESEVLRTVLGAAGDADMVLSIGGGALEAPENQASLRSAATIVFLDVGKDSAWERVNGSDRPLAQDRSRFDALCEQRKATFEKCASWTFPTDDRSEDEVANDLARMVEWGALGLTGSWARRLSGTTRPSLVLGGAGAVELLQGPAAAKRADGVTLHGITDTNVLDAWGNVILPALGLSSEDVHVIESGERSKSVGVLEECWEWLAGRKARRDDVVVAIGGGVVGDLAGLVAATYYRGVGLWQVPTSLVAQVDSSVGGKTAVNLRAGKNLVGVFHQPDLVVIDPTTLLTLPRREYTGALGEVVKHALLSSDAAMNELEQNVAEIRNRDPQVLSALVRRNVEHKAAVVGADERERGLRASLNLGHTTAHALEASLGYGTVNHGQAVALGLLVALRLSEELLGLDAHVRRRTAALLDGLGLDTTIELPPHEALAESSAHDKKAKTGNTGFVGLRAIGRPVWGVDVEPSRFEEALKVIAR